MERKIIEDAVKEIRANLDTIAKVYEWAELMGYNDSKIFSRHFLRHFHKRPSEVLTRVRLKSIIKMLRKSNKSCLEIAWKHSMTDEKVLNNYTNRHLGISPSMVKELPAKKLENRLDKMRSKYVE